MSETTLYSSSKHLPVLDGVRGFAVFLVVVFHFYGIGFGWLGVDLFFVLSGFLITGILVDSKEKPHFFRNFYARRTLRIFPLYYFALIVFFILIALNIHQLKDPHFYTQHAAWYLLYIQNWLYAWKDWPRDGVLNHFWSLAIEEQFYLFWPLLVYFLPTRKLLTTCIILIAVSVMSRYLVWYQGADDTPVQFVATICRLDGLAIGASIALLIRHNPQWLMRSCKWIFIITIPVIISLYLLAKTIKYDSVYYMTAGFTFFDLFWGGILISCFLPEFNLSRRFFSSKWLTWLGKYSYGIYVYHWIIYQMCWPWFRVAAGNVVIADVRYIYGTLCLAATLLISIASYRFLEQPVLSLKKRFS
ncbi:MAG: acyltransferase [Bacteroidota bacterium]